MWQVRYPDATVTFSDGSRQVMDCKFTQGSGRPDVWGTAPGQHRRATQLQDYTQIFRCAPDAVHALLHFGNELAHTIPLSRLVMHA